MGFRQGGWCTVWSTEPSKSGSTTRVRLSVSRKDKQTGAYVPDFSGYCTFIGKAHEGAKKLQEKDRIKILACDVSTSYDKEKQKEYINYKVFAFETSGSRTPSDGTAVPAERSGAFGYEQQV